MKTNIPKFQKWFVFGGFIALSMLTTPVAGAVVFVGGLIAIFFGGSFDAVAPLVIVALAFPAIYLFTVLMAIFLKLGRIAGLSKNGPGATANFVVSATLAGGVLMVPPYIINTYNNTRNEGYLASDLNKIKKPVHLDTIAVVAYRGDNPCQVFCRRALLNNVVRKVIMVNARWPYVAFNQEKMKGTAYWLEKREVCPALPKMSLSSSSMLGKLDYDDHYDKGFSSIDLIQLRADQGICLVSGEEYLASADGIIVDGYFLHRSYRGLEAFNPFDDLPTITRRSFYQRKNQTFELMYQETALEAYPLYRILAPVASAVKAQGGPGFYRTTESYGELSDSGIIAGYYEFLTATLGFNLAIDLRELDAAEARKLEKLLNTKNPLSQEEDKDFIDEYFKTSAKKGNKLSKEKIDFILATLEDPRIEVPNYTEQIMSKIVLFAPQRIPEFSKVLLARLKAFKPNLEKVDKGREYDQLYLISEAIGALPSGAVKPDFDMLSALADDLKARNHSKGVLVLLGEYETKGAEKLLSLIKDADRYYRNKNRQWQVLNETGLGGLCRMGRNGYRNTAVLNELLELTKQGIIEPWGRGKSGPWKTYVFSLEISTLVSLGATDQQIMAATKPFVDRAGMKSGSATAGMSSTDATYQRQRELSARTNAAADIKTAIKNADKITKVRC